MNKQIFKLLRPHQWLKNLFVFVPLFFDRHATDWHYVWPCFLGFLAFCLVASGIYCFNDIFDAESDRNHPTKCQRPIACNSVNTQTAFATMIIAWITAFILIACTNFEEREMRQTVTETLLCYIVMNIAYCIKLKQIAILDVFVISTGFVLRIVVGSLVTGIIFSHWIILITFLLALFLALSKRRDDVIIFKTTGIKTRKNVENYSMDFLNLSISFLGSIVIMCYILYTVSEDVMERMGNRNLYATSIFVLAGILRYMQITFVDQKSGSPTSVLSSDLFIQLCITCWIVAFVIILYL